MTPAFREPTNIMRFLPSVWRAALLAASMPLILATFTTNAFAQDGPNSGDPAVEPKGNKKPENAPPADARAANATEPKPEDGDKILGPIERLPPSAFPEPRVRGIQGGSLWMTFHGLQWPYYPKTGIGVSGSGWIDLPIVDMVRVGGATGGLTSRSGSAATTSVLGDASR